MQNKPQGTLSDGLEEGERAPLNCSLQVQYSCVPPLPDKGGATTSPEGYSFIWGAPFNTRVGI